MSALGDLYCSAQEAALLLMLRSFVCTLKLSTQPSAMLSGGSWSVMLQTVSCIQCSCAGF